MFAELNNASGLFFIHMVRIRRRKFVFADALVNRVLI